MMSLTGLGFGIGGHGYCHLCSSAQCHHIMRGQQNMNNDQYHQMLRQMSGAQQQAVTISVPDSGAIVVSNGGIGISVPPSKPKLNKKLLLLRR